VPFCPILAVFYVPIYLLFTNESFPVKMRPVFLVEGASVKLGGGGVYPTGYAALNLMGRP
jgi:hypothetical protein